MSQNQKSDEDGLDDVTVLPVRHIGSLVAGVIVALLALMLIQGMVTNKNMDWPIVWKYLFDQNVLRGIAWTLILTVASMLIAIILAVLLAVMRKSLNPVLRGVSWFYIWFFRGTPVWTQLVFWGLFSVLIPQISLGVPFTSISFWSMDSDRFTQAIQAGLLPAILGLALNEAAYLAEIVRAGLEAVDPGQSEAAKALGMRSSKIMRRIILPQAMRIIVPPTGNETIGMLKTTSLVTAVPFGLELQFATNAIANRIYKPIPLLLVACVWYLLITSILMVGQAYLERHFGKGFDQRRVWPPKDAVPLPGKTEGEVKNDVSKGNQATFVGLNA
ncbi:amino acid ABC transporter permease [Bifidobacterium subtile]|jgi:polar amino acid transport system permease protein|uniref:Permease protein of ABC transporter system n=1 Tax=Bifidobacterium subtile TaxID=77635 RepID=A0A087E8N8_9BIFI|nr:amino acid ABC transporter permease [Bifidobacterium subtile]KFJ04139.1 Permease protein of ABC transporter system [Bifidobacterium subtile]MCI1223129.1 amino acid ABC transporter permease [Bifidobacterium subtile]MCI1240617.1 amino acid ABC transporter permease [Bifidobacterium subtile]MCI1258057.1 amino acid ABC transporter permease [Bifidobacterium subtile]QOL36834.1 amino acid ABC transporter permease [Bifidobacterium subtile]